MRSISLVQTRQLLGQGLPNNISAVRAGGETESMRAVRMFGGSAAWFVQQSAGRVRGRKGLFAMSDKVYQQTGDYIPETDAGFRDWLGNFSTLIQADPSKYGLGGSDATVISDLNTSYNDVYTLVQSPATRTPGLVTQKDAVKASAKASCRVYAMQIKANAGVDNQDKLQLGIHVNDPTPTPIPAPVTAPLLNITAAFSGEHILQYADENTPASKRKPAGATQLELYVFVGPQATANWLDATFAGVYTKNPIQYMFTPDKAGQTATYFAKWRTAKGLAGPFSLGVAMMIAFGGPVDQQIPVAPGEGTPLSAPGTGEDDLKIAA